LEQAMRPLRLIVGGFVIALTLAIASTALLEGHERQERQERREQHGRSQAVEQRGIALPTWRINGYDGTTTTQAISDIAGLGATWIEFTPTWNMATGTSTKVDGIYRVTDASLKAAIDFAHSKGLKVLLKPHVDPRDGTNRWEINPSSRPAWFDSYQTMITYYADIAQRNGVDEFSVGCELASMSGPADRGAWLTVITAIKAIYSGPLVYAATSDEYPNVSFWDQLNFVGIDAYFPLSTQPTTDVSALEAAWIPIRNQMSAFAAGVGRQIVFTEAGYPSQAGAAVNPWNNQNSSTVSQPQQAAAYEALLATFAGEPWWTGVFWWSWWTDNGEYDALDFALKGKLAESVLRNWWAPNGRHETAKTFDQASSGE
jgi:hypothetical protein